jgi:hypothetical protein
LASIFALLGIVLSGRALAGLVAIHRTLGSGGRTIQVSIPVGLLGPRIGAIAGGPSLVVVLRATCGFAALAALHRAFGRPLPGLRTASIIFGRAGRIPRSSGVLAAGARCRLGLGERRADRKSRGDGRG